MADGSRPRKRRDPVEILVESNKGRVPELVPLRFGRMSQSPFAFYRGAAAIMAADLAGTPQFRAQGAGLRRCPSDELRRLRHARAAGGLRYQRPRRDTARPLGMGSQASGREHRHRRSVICSSAKTRRRGRRRRRCAPTASAWPTIPSMRALDVWYDTDYRRARDGRMSGSEKVRKRAAKRLAESPRSTALPKRSFRSSPSTTERSPRIKDNPPLIFHHSARNMAPGMPTQYSEALASLSRVAARARARAVRPLPLLRSGDQGRRRRQRRHRMLHRAVHGRRR